MSECAGVYLARGQSLTGFIPLDPADGEGGMEAEAREILMRAVRRSHIGMALMNAAHEAGGVQKLPVLERTDTARIVDFG